MGVEIGPAVAGEWPWILQRSTATGQAQVSPVLQGPGVTADLTHRIQGLLTHALGLPGSVALVARDQGRPVGYLVVTPVPDELTGVGVGLFADIWVEPDWRRRGVAGRLTAAGESHCRGLGLRSVRRLIAAHNAASVRHALADGCQVERWQLIKPL